jgi:diamine N-acetyltransferase
LEKSLKLRYGEPKDAKALAEIGAKTFYDAYVETVDLENLKTVVNESFSEEYQLEEINHPDTVFLIAEVDGRMAGYAKLKMNAVSEHVSTRNPAELSRIYLLREHIGKGIGKELMQGCINEARQRSCDSIWLGVWENNQKAINFYKKVGFREVGSQTFMFGRELQTDIVMELVFRPFPGGSS